MASAAGHAQAQSLTRDLFRPERGGFVSPQDLPLQRDAAASPLRADPYATDNDTRRDSRTPSRLGSAPNFGASAQPRHRRHRL